MVQESTINWEGVSMKSYNPLGLNYASHMAIACKGAWEQAI